MPDLQDMSLEQSVEGTILTRVQDRLRALALPGIDADRIVVRKRPWDTNLEPPYIVISPAPEDLDWQRGTNEKDETIFAIFVGLVLANERHLTQYMGLQLYWRDRIRLKFMNKTINTWSELTFTHLATSGFVFKRSYVESGDKFIESAFREQRDAQFYVIRVVVGEPRE